jgi:outer membrane protein assembly factor BamD
MRLYLPLTGALLVSLVLTGCSSTPKTPPTSNTNSSRITDIDEKVLKQDPLERNYDPHVIMKRAESFYEKENYAEAAVEYQHFLDLHKTHMLAPYAQYRLALSYHNLVTTKDRDPGPVRQTLEAMEKLLKDYPGSTYDNEARAKITEARNHLAAYEVYVGRQYLRKAAYLGAMHRFEGVLTRYPETDAVADARYYLALTYKELGDNRQAADQLASLLTQFPKAPVRKDGQALLSKLTGKSLNGATAAAASTAPVATTKPTIPPPLPSTHPSLAQSSAASPVGLSGSAPPMITCGLNTSC